jgi:hypothetical protein
VAALRPPPLSPAPNRYYVLASSFVCDAAQGCSSHESAQSSHFIRSQSLPTMESRHDVAALLVSRAVAPAGNSALPAQCSLALVPPSP